MLQNKRFYFYYLLTVFLLANVFIVHGGGGNPWSRVATMISMKEDASFRIDKYISKTSDWAQTPEGSYYSNKAPGPMLLGFPVFLFIDKILTRGQSTPEMRNNVRLDRGNWYSHFLSLFLQCLPAVLIALFALKILGERRVSFEARLIFLLGYLFASTASLKMNTFFGHAFAANFALLGFLFFLKNRYVLCGFCFSMLLLSDYSGAFLLFSFPLSLVLFGEFRRRRFFDFLWGSLPAAFFWIFYHFVCFGSPLKIATHFQNPAHVDMLQEKDNLFGVIGMFPRWALAKELLYSSERGLLVTQAWILLCIVASIYILFFRRGTNSPVKILTFSSGLCFLLLFYMNASFQSWHGGATPGPRYLSYIFPSMALGLALQWSYLSRVVHVLFGIGVGLSTYFYCLIMSSRVNPPFVPLWHTYSKYVFEQGNPPQAPFRFALLFVSFAIFGLLLFFNRASLGKNS